MTELFEKPGRNLFKKTAKGINPLGIRNGYVMEIDDYASTAIIEGNRINKRRLKEIHNDWVKSGIIG